MIKVNKIFIGAIASAALLAGCKTTPKAPPGPLKVTYSKAPYAAPRLKETPTEVRIVRREETSAAVAAQVGVHLLMAALGGGAAINTFNKEDLKGVPIEDVVDRQYLNNPVPTSFVQSLQEAVDASIAENPWAQQKSFSYPLVVGGGSAQLIYDNLMGTDDANYQLVLDLDVSKKREAGKRKNLPVVQCSGRSEPAQPLAYWAEDSYRNVQQELNRMLADCQAKVLADLPNLLEQ
ncbi:hypothetical protein [Comamonas sediminis]|uniref:Lipoprotein n=1 Tax=Comamonas sediminis TaxID=1783360 RepID=A0ABV4B4Y2_9BURK